MKTQITLSGDAKILDALAKFLAEFEKTNPEPVAPPKAIRGEDNVIYVEAGVQNGGRHLRGRRPYG
jgi:hypothetical protein